MFLKHCRPLLAFKSKSCLKINYWSWHRHEHQSCLFVILVRFHIFQLTKNGTLPKPTKASPPTTPIGGQISQRKRFVTLSTILSNSVQITATECFKSRGMKSEQKILSSGCHVLPFLLLDHLPRFFSFILFTFLQLFPEVFFSRKTDDTGCVLSKQNRWYFPRLECPRTPIRPKSKNARCRVTLSALREWSALQWSCVCVKIDLIYWRYLDSRFSL